MKTVFGSLSHFEKGRVEVIDDNAKNYAFSNVFEICSKSKPYEKVVMGINQIYVLEAIRAEGSSPWFSCAHDEFVLNMDGEVYVHMVKLDRPAVANPEKNGAIQLNGEPAGKKMGWMKLKRGHQGMLPANCAYQFRAAKPAALVLQTTLGDLSVQKWALICQAA
ncbi:MAG: hydroxyquinol 1,2-dioxygenase [Betaproteobacteria bacterium]|nr:hydroxyquinol 1,2-dioxygenase [Betaproteobacteria bacterium]